MISNVLIDDDTRSIVFLDSTEFILESSSDASPDFFSHLTIMKSFLYSVPALSKSIAEVSTSNSGNCFDKTHLVMMSHISESTGSRVILSPS